MDACSEAVNLHPHAAETIVLLERNLVANGVDLKLQPVLLGTWLELEPENGEIRAVSDAKSMALAEARRLARGAHRPGYEISSGA